MLEEKARALNSYLRKRVAVIGIFLAAVFILFAVVRYFAPALMPGFSKAPTVDQGLQEFLESHWQKPIPFQGQAPANFSALEASLKPEACEYEEDLCASPA